MFKMKKAFHSIHYCKALVILILFTCLCSISMGVSAAEKVTIIKDCKYNFSDSSTANVVWSSSNPAVAEVSGNGVVQALKTGSADITASRDGTLVVDYAVKVIKFKPVKMEKLKCYSKYRKYMSTKEFTKAYKAACKLVKPYAGLSKKQKLYAVAQELRTLFDKYGSYSMSNSHYNDPYGYLIKHVASCAGCTRATGLCLNILGISFEHVNENQYSHQWCRIKVGKEYWICDAFGLYVGKEPGKRKHPRF